MVTTFTYQTQFGEDRCTHSRVIVVTDPHTQTNRQDRLQYTAQQLARSVIKGAVGLGGNVCSIVRPSNLTYI